MHTIGLSLASLLLTTTPQINAPVPTYTLTVALFNDARVSPTVLAGAQETASYIFSKSGIDIHIGCCAAAKTKVPRSAAPAVDPSSPTIWTCTSCAAVPVCPSVCLVFPTFRRLASALKPTFSIAGSPRFGKAARRQNCEFCSGTPWPMNSDICCWG